MANNYESAFETLSELRNKLNEMEDDLKSIAHEYPRQATAVGDAYVSLSKFRDALWALDKHFETLPDRTQ